MKEHKNRIQQQYQQFKISAPTWNETSDLPNGFYSIADIQDILNLSSRNMKLYLRILQYIFIQTK